MSDHDAANGLNPSEGGKARARKLAPAQREEIARRAADARWNIPQATHLGMLHLAGRNLECAVLEDGRRIIGQQSMMVAIGRTGRPNRAEMSGDKGCFTPPAFLAAENLKPYIG